MFKKIKQKNKTIHEITHDNIMLLEKTLSKSGIDFKELYYINHNKYFTCFQIFEFPEDSTQNQLNAILIHDNTYITIDVTPLSEETFKDQYDKTIDKQSEKFQETRRRSQENDVMKERRDLDDFYHIQLESRSGVSRGTVRVFVFGKSYEELEHLSNEVHSTLRRLQFTGAYIQTNNLQADYKSLGSFDNSVKQLFLNDTLADWTARSNISVVDEESLLLGYTNNGVFVFNQFSFRNNSYSLMVISGMGGGKSALLKKLAQNKLLTKTHVLNILDIHSEYDEYAKTLGIVSVDFDEGKHINFLQIFFINSDDDRQIINDSAISIKVGSVVETFSNYTGITTSTTKILFSLILTEMYQTHKGKELSYLNNDDWFTLEKVISVIEKKEFDFDRVSKQIGFNIENEMKELVLGLNKMILQDGFIFNQTTNVDLDLSKSIRFNIGFLREQNKRTKSAYVSMLLEYIGQGVHLNQQRNYNLAQDLGVVLNDLKRPLISHEVLIDETMQYVENDGFLLTINDLMKYQRKCFSGSTFVIHTTTDVDKKDTDENADLLEEMFKLAPNRIIGMVENEDLTRLKELLPTLTDSDIQTVLNFKKNEETGERQFLSIDNQKRKIVFTSIITRLERSFYKGGV